MRLLKASTIELHEFVGDRVPEYAILSHRWGEEEVSMQELKTMDPGSTHTSKGYTKIKRACALAEYYDLEFIWIDTCCIDKTSSAELSEAINSMYRWYAWSKLCFAHLADIELRPAGHLASKRFVYSEWFGRGWTLQELLAPTNLLFFDADWQEIGTRSALVPLIAGATQISPEFLRQEKDVHDASIAQRMSWASSRTTTRVEDLAYCLMGLFDVNMPLLYGEGEKAFLRLQEELISNHRDESIYAWEAIDSGRPSSNLSGMLASEPKCFVRSGRIVSIELPGMRQTPFSMTNRGIAMTLPAEAMKGGRYDVPMACASMEDLRAPLRLCIKEDANGSYARVHSHEGLTFIPSNHNMRNLRMETLHVSLSSSHRYLRRDLKSTSDHYLLIIQLRPAARQVLRLVNHPGAMRLANGSLVWQRTFSAAADFVVQFLYKERQSIHLVLRDDKIALHIVDICQTNGCEYFYKEITASESMCNTRTLSNTIPPSQTLYEQGPSLAGGMLSPITAGKCLLDNCTFTDWGGCQSRPLSDGKFLWLSTRVLGEYDGDWIFKDYVLDFDISTIDRRTVF